MPRVYDDWERLVGAILRRERDRQLAYCESLSSSSSTAVSSGFSFEIPFAGDVHQPTTEVYRSFGQKIDRSSSNIFFSRNVRAMEYEEIRKATGYFQGDNLLKIGSSSCVYKGWIDEHNLVAVRPGFGIPVSVKIKKVTDVKDVKLQKKWMEEISHLRHPNLLTPIGYYFNTDQTIFIHEFMPKRSLDNHLFRWRQETLPWATRIKVAVGAARALAFLHGLETPVIHGTLNIYDIVLDDDLNAKLSNVGLPRDVSIHELEGPIDIIHEDGLAFCAAPEYIETGLVSTKCDVYGFGVVLVQLISGLRDIVRNPNDKVNNLMDWATPYLGNRRRLRQVMDSRLEGEYSLKQAWKVAQLALRCVSSDPRSRPTMAEVVAALQQL